MDESQNRVNRTAPHSEPGARLVNQIRVMPFRALESAPKIICHIGRLDIGSIEITFREVFDEESRVPRKNVQLLYASFHEMRLEGFEQHLAG